MRRRALLIPLAACLAAGSAHAESADWLSRMATAVRTQNYQGVMVYVQNGRMESMRIVHRYRDGHEQERMQALTGQPREIHRDNDVVTCILPKERSVKLERRGFRGLLPGLSSDSAEQVASHYQVEERGSARMVDRECREVLVRPRDIYRYGYRMWVDQDTAVPLKVELLGARGDALEQVMFTQIEYPASIDDSALRPSVDGRNFVWIRHGAAAGQTRVQSGGSWMAERLPPGFRMVVQELQQLPGAPDPVEHMVFSDGLASVSVFVAPEGAPRAFQGVSRMGAVNAYGKMHGNHHVTVVGEVPQVTVEYIAGGLRYAPVEAPIAPAP